MPVADSCVDGGIALAKNRGHFFLRPFDGMIPNFDPITPV